MATPKLRFKEFDGDWTSKQLGKIIGISSASRVFKEQWQDSGVPFFRTSDVVSIFKNKENEKAYISLELFEELAKKSGKIKQGDLLVTGGGSIGIPYLVANDQPLYFKDADLLWMKSSGIVEGSFLYNFFISPKFREYLKSISHTGTISHFTIEQAKATPFGFPSKEEQTKIATFLSAVDEKISQLTQKHQLLSQYKQGMMQKLFSQQIRFKADDGSEFGEWEYVFLGDISKPQQWKTISSSELTEIGYPVFGANGYIGFYPKYNHINETIVVTCRGATCGEVTLVKAKSYITGNAMSIDEINEKEHSTLYIYYALCFRGFKDVISGSAQPQIVGNAIRKVTFQVPCLEEQTKIANFLSAIDQKMNVVFEQLKQAQNWKKGLLQQMFV